MGVSQREINTPMWRLHPKKKILLKPFICFKFYALCLRTKLFACVKQLFLWHADYNLMKRGTRGVAGFIGPEYPPGTDYVGQNTKMALWVKQLLIIHLLILWFQCVILQYILTISGTIHSIINALFSWSFYGMTENPLCTCENRKLHL